MKVLLPALLLVSLGLNLGLAIVLFAGRGQPPVPAPALAPLAPPAPAPARPLDHQAWAGLEGSDFATLRQRLRDGGFPPEMIRAILTARVRESFAARRRAIDPPGRPYWQDGYADPGRQSALRQLDREQRDILRGLLGPDAEPASSMVFQGRRLEGVPEEKRDDVRQVLRDFDDQRSDIYGLGGMIGPDQQKKLTALEKAQQDALGRLLSPAELEDFNLRNSDTARQLRYELTAFDATEEEFKTIYRLRADFDQRFGRMYGPSTQEEMQQRMEADKQLKSQINAALGPVRGAEYERASDYTYRQTSQLVARLDLPRETTDAIYQVQKDIQSRLQEAYRTGLAPAEREARMAALASEAKTRLAGLLGDRGFQAYQQYGGTWMRSLTRPPPGRPPAP